MLTALLRPIPLVFALAACTMTTPTSISISPELRDAFAPTGTLRIGVNLGNPVVAQKDPLGGAPRGVGPDLGRELARRLGVPVAAAIICSSVFGTICCVPAKAGSVIASHVLILPLAASGP